MTVEIITIGDEILQGQIVDTNSAWIAKQLIALSIPVVQITTIADRKEAIETAFVHAESRADVIVVTGGLGPTKDDVTKQTAANYFGTQLVRNQTVLDHVRGIFAKRGREMPVMNESQADVFADGEVLFNDFGTAPGLAIEKGTKWFVFLPGVPYEMKHLVDVYLLPRLLSKLGQVKVHNAYILTAGIGESHLAERIADIEAQLPEHIRLAFLPKLGIVRLRLTGVSDNEESLKQELSDFAMQIGERVEEYVVAYEDVEFEWALVEKMKQMELRVGTAESCTGGNIAHRLTEISGVSAVFRGSIVAYDNELKERLLGVRHETLEEFGAVSEQVVTEMALGALDTLGVDYAIATSGIAGPTGATPGKPVGLIWIAVASKFGVRTHRSQFHLDRIINIERATTQGLLLLWKELKAS